MTDTTLLAKTPYTDRSTLSAVIVGTVVALGLMVLFTLLGLAIGVASLEAIGSGFGFGTALYIIVTQIISLAAGGFAAARFMSPADSSIAGLAGASVWALATLVVAFSGISAGTSLITLVARTADTTASAVGAIVPDDISLPDMSEIAGSISTADLPPQLQQTLQDAGVTPAQLRTEAREAFRNVISEQEMNRARSLVTATLSDVVAEPASFSEEMNALLDQLLGGENAVFNEEDLTEAENSLQSRLGLSDNEVEQLSDSVEASYDSAVATLRQTIDEMQERLVTTVENVQSTVASAALWLFIASLLSLGAAAGAGVAGRRT